MPLPTGENLKRDLSESAENARDAQPEDGLDDPQVFAALKEYVAATEAGQTPDRERFLAAHADIAVPLAKCLESLKLVWAAAPRLRTLAGEGMGAARTADIPQALGDFRIYRELGRGGMGIVYEAEQLSLARRVALKVLPFASALDVTRLQRFKNEAQAAAQLHHTNIVPVYAVGVDRGVHFYAMQLIEGKTLASVVLEMRHTVPVRAGEPNIGLPPGQSSITDEWPANRAAAGAAPQVPSPSQQQPSASLHLPHRDTVQAQETVPFSKQLSDDRRSGRSAFFQAVSRLGVQAAEALEHAHQMGVIHRDIKPGNLLIDGRGKLWVTDFGLAQFHEVGGLTISGNLPGTIRYMSPEQATGQRVILDHRTDIYSLGVTLYELVTLRPAFDDVDGRLLIRHIASEEPPAPRTIDRAIPADLETILLKSMAKSPADRYQTAQALADDLQRFLDHQPIRARRPRPLERLAKWARRHKPLVAAGVLLLFFTAIGFLASTVMVAREHVKTKVAYQREIEQRAAAERNFQQARQAVDTFTQLGEEELAMKPGTYQLRRKFLAAALDYYESFLEQHHDDPAVQAELAASRAQVARIIDELSVLSSFGPLMLLSDNRVQAELGVSAQQSERVDALIDELFAQSDQANDAEQRDLSLADRQHAMAEMLRSREEQIENLITPAQMRRLRQLGWQQQGPFAFKRPEVIEALHLSLEDRKRITDIIEETSPRHSKKGHGEFSGEHGPPPEPPGGHKWAGGPREHDGGPFGGFGYGGPKGPPPSRTKHPRTEASENAVATADSASTEVTPEEAPADGEPAGKGPRRGFGGRFDSHGPRGFGDHRHGPGHDDGGPGPHNDMRKAMNRTVAEIVKSFTPEQQAAWKELVGEPVSFDLQHGPQDMFFW